MRIVFKIRPDTSFFTETPEASTLYSKFPFFSLREVFRGKDQELKDFAPFPFKINLVR
jgi:hypothetical protein